MNMPSSKPNQGELFTTIRSAADKWFAAYPASFLRWALSLCLLPVALYGVALHAQTLGTSRTAIPDQQDAALQQLLANAQTDLNNKDFQSAARNYSSYLAQKPDDAVAHFQLGFAYSNLRQPDKAEQEYRRATELDPKMGAAYLNLGLTLLGVDPATAVAPLQKAADLLPQDPRAKFSLADALQRSGQLPAAIDQFEAALKIDPKNTAIHVALGRALLQSNRPTDAEPEFRAALAIESGSSVARSGLIETLIAEKKYTEATAELDQYLNANPNDIDARFDYASLLAQQGKNDEALVQLDRAAATRPESLRALELRSDIDAQKNDWSAAAAALQKAVALAPQNAQIQAHLGHALLQQKNYSAATPVLVAALRIEPQLTDALKDLLTAEYLNGNYPQALQLLDLLGKREPLPAGSWFIRAACYDKMGQQKEALDAYQKFLELNAGQTTDQYFVATARVRTLERELKQKR